MSDVDMWAGEFVPASEATIADCVAVYDALAQRGPVEMSEYSTYSRMLRTGLTVREVVWRMEMDYRNRGLAMGRNLPTLDTDEEMRRLRAEAADWQRTGHRLLVMFLAVVSAAVAVAVVLVWSWWPR